MVCVDPSTHQRLPIIFSFNRRKFLKYSKMQNHIQREAKPEVCDPLAAGFRELEGRSKRGASGIGGRSRQRFWGEQGCGELGHCPECTRGPLRGFEQGVAVQIC